MNSTQAEPLVKINSVSHNYSQGDSLLSVLNNLNGIIDRGEILALLGRSGCGKSTLLNIICGIDKPSEGSVQVNGIDLTSLDEHNLTLFRRQHIGVIYQFFNLIPTLNVEGNLLLPLELNGWSKNDSSKRITELLQAVGLSNNRNSFPEQLSGGEQQRVAIARAIAHRPKLILADEPTGNLDVQSGQQILDLLEKLVRDEDATLIVVTHSHAVASWADRVLTLSDGKLTAEAEKVLW